jgi:hypothetical protein
MSAIVGSQRLRPESTPDEGGRGVAFRVVSSGGFRRLKMRQVLDLNRRDALGPKMLQRPSR